MNVTFKTPQKLFEFHIVGAFLRAFPDIPAHGQQQSLICSNKTKLNTSFIILKSWSTT